MKAPAFRTRPVTEKNWKDFETLFESKGAPSYCWCMVWRMNSAELKQNDPASRKKFIKKRVMEGTPVGLLAYDGRDPVAWCSIAPRETYRRLGGDETIKKVWSIACFFIRREYRHAGLVDLLVEKAKAYARKHKARFAEAYPVKPDSPSYRFMGQIHTFKKAGFTHVKKAGSRRHVMTCPL